MFGGLQNETEPPICCYQVLFLASWHGIRTALANPLPNRIPRPATA